MTKLRIYGDYADILTENGYPMINWVPLSTARAVCEILNALMSRAEAARVALEAIEELASASVDVHTAYKILEHARAGLQPYRR